MRRHRKGHRQYDWGKITIVAIGFLIAFALVQGVMWLINR